MSTHKAFDRICCGILAMTLVLTVLFLNGERLGVQAASTVMGYEKKLFDTEQVHTIDILMEDWDSFLADCQSETYYSCTVVIDNEAYKNVAIRGKGNTSLTQVAAYGNDRYSFKIEFDHYDSTGSYYGLDKLCLNNIIQDNTYLKDYLVYQMMGQMGVAAPLCSYVYITVNGEDWGLYLAVEGVEESFLQRNYGKNYGELYKPDSQNMGGGRGNGGMFDMQDFLKSFDAVGMPDDDTTGTGMTGNKEMHGNAMPGGQMPDDMTPPDGAMGSGMAGNAGMQGSTAPDGQQPGGGMLNGEDDVLLKYVDDNIESYSNIFDNAKTDVTEVDKIRLIAALEKLSQGDDLENTVDREQVIRYFVVHNFVLNFDSYTGSMIHNYYLYEKDGQLQMIPWDYNLAFGGFESAGGATSLINYPIDEPVSGGNVADRPMLAWIFADADMTALYHQSFSEFLTTYFDSGYFEEMMEKVTAMIAPYVEKDPTKFCTYEAFQTGAATLKQFILLRAESVAGQLAGTIGATTETQEETTLIRADNLQISDMGSMNLTMGSGESEFPESAGKENPTMPDGQMPMMPGEKNEKMQWPQWEDDEMSGESKPMQNPAQTEKIVDSDGWLLAVSVGILLLGLAFAVRFKQRRK